MLNYKDATKVMNEFILRLHSISINEDDNLNKDDVERLIRKIHETIYTPGYKYKILITLEDDDYLVTFDCHGKNQPAYFIILDFLRCIQFTDYEWVTPSDSEKRRKLDMGLYITQRLMYDHDVQALLKPKK